MASYIQVGVCTDVIIDKADFARARITRDEAVQKLTGELLDLSMFIEHEDADELRWTLPGELVETGLVPFLRAQYALLGRHAPRDPEATLALIAGAGGYEGIVALARARPMPEFQAGTLGEILSIGPARRALPIRTDVLIYLIEGKAIMEEYGQLFAYMEALIHGQKGQFPIAAAVKVFLE
jgi:hypothetical protein